MTNDELQNFFNQISLSYDKEILKIVPDYNDILWSMFYYLPQDFIPKNILELGCGTGNLTKLIKNTFSNSQIITVDASSMMIEEAKNKLNDSNIMIIESYFEALDFQQNKFDLIMSNISLHHLTDKEKRKLFSKLFKWLKPGSYFVYSDGIRNDDEERYKLDLKHWDELCLKNGISPENFELLHKHRNESDFYAKFSDIFNWLKESGFKNIDVVFRHCIWNVIYCQK